MKISFKLHELLFGIALVSIEFHHIIIQYFPFYRDVIGFAYMALIINLLYKKSKKPYLSFDFWPHYTIFLLLLVIQSMYDTNYRLYGDAIKVSTATSFVSEDYVVFYVLRNAFLYYPMITYYFINRKALEKQYLVRVFWIYLLCIPVAVFLYTSTAFEVDLTFSSLLIHGQYYIPYNTYVPHLALPAIISMCLFQMSKHLVLKLYTCALFLTIIGYSFISGSRQSVIFLIVIFLFTVRSISSKELMIIFTLCLLSLMIVSTFVLNSFEINKEVANKFVQGKEVLESSRFSKIKDGFALLKPYEYIFGAGISSVPDGGPHNDFVRWIQRSGLLVGLYGFLPFSLLYFKNARRYKVKGDTIYLMVSLCALFLFYTSLFGYPRDDTYQSLVVFIAPVIFYGYDE